MNKYKNIHVSPDFHFEFKIFAAQQSAGMGELIEEIVREHIRNFEARNENKEETNESTINQAR